MSQPQVWAQALSFFNTRASEVRALLNSGGYDSLIFTGCGSTYYLALAAAAQMQALSGIPCRGLPASELWLNPGAAYPRVGRCCWRRSPAPG